MLLSAAKETVVSAAKGTVVDEPVLASQAELHTLWFSLQDHPWNSLAIVPVDSAVSAPDVAADMVRIAQRHGRRPVRFIDATGVRLDAVGAPIESLRNARGDCTIAIVDPPSENPAALPIARAASASIVLVQLGQSLLTTARSTVNGIGRDRVLGAIVVPHQRTAWRGLFRTVR